VTDFILIIQLFLASICDKNRVKCDRFRVNCDKNRVKCDRFRVNCDKKRVVTATDKKHWAT
jgi:hypothetical protein